MKKDFAIDYTNSTFLCTSRTAAHAHRLNWRCEVLLRRNLEAVENQRILDLASHDGRFSYACLRLGAKHVTGIEGRSHLVKHAEDNLARLRCDEKSYSFLQGDIFDYLPTFRAFSFDTVLCFGFLYHTVKQVELIKEVSRLCPRHFILDSAVARELDEASVLARLLSSARRFRLRHIVPGRGTLAQIRRSFSDKKAYALFRYSDTTDESTTIDHIGICATPSKTLIEMLLGSHGFTFEELPWDRKEIKDWSNLDDYRSGSRVSYLAQPRTQ